MDTEELKQGLLFVPPLFFSNAITKFYRQSLRCAFLMDTRSLEAKTIKAVNECPSVTQLSGIGDSGQRELVNSGTI